MGKQALLSLFNCSLQWVRISGLTGFVALLQFRKNRLSNTILHLIAVTLLLTCLPLLSTAQLVPLKTFQISLFAQTPQKSEKEIDKTQKKQEVEKAKSGKMDGKEYNDKSRIKVKDPTLFEQSEENKIFSGPQPGEKLPSLTVTGIDGELDSQTFNITAKADGKPLILFLQDTNGVGVKGLVNVSNLLLKIDAFQKRHSKAMGAEKSNQGLQIGVVFLADNLDTLPDWAHNMLNEEIPNEILTGISPEGREGPGSYGLNRNVAQTVIVAKDGKVLHNFAFTQPMLYTDPHLLGAIAQAIEVETATLEKWLNEKPAESKRMEGSRGQMERERSPSREELVKRFDKDGDGKLNEEEGMAMRRALASRENQNQTRSRNTRVVVKNPAEFKKIQGEVIFSGPQPGEKLPPLMAKGINGEVKDKTYDVIAKADGQPLALFLQDESGLGLRGLLGISRLLAQIAEKSEQTMHISAVFLGDTPNTVENQASKLVPHIPSGVSLGVSQEGREGPGSYGLNRSVAQTVIIAKDGKVLHNFTFTQPMLQPDPYVLGAVGETLGIKFAVLEKWLNEKPAEGKRMQREDTSEEARAFGRRLREMVEKGEITGEEARKRYEKAFPRSKED